MKLLNKKLLTGGLAMAMVCAMALPTFAAEPSNTSTPEVVGETEKETRAGDSWVGQLTSEVKIGGGFFLGQDISCYNSGNSAGSVQFRIPDRSPIGVTPGGGCQFQDVWGSKDIYAAPISGYGTYTLSWTA